MGSPVLTHHLKDHTIRIADHHGQRLGVCFQRTPYVPDDINDKIGSSPNQRLEKFPLYSVREYAQKLPPDMAEGSDFLNRHILYINNTAYNS